MEDFKTGDEIKFLDGHVEYVIVDRSTGDVYLTDENPIKKTPIPMREFFGEQNQ